MSAKRCAQGIQPMAGETALPFAGSNRTTNFMASNFLASRQKSGWQGPFHATASQRPQVGQRPFAIGQSPRNTRPSLRNYPPNRLKRGAAKERRRRHGVQKGDG